ncbi:VOC family protein [Actinomadura rubrisoli]|uniref:4-hydroxyphenylpyruvate dioxygenase n=1 Tax=Actinomadura rubrisoli TaxID=2530368 RepID=A0A4R5C885_9ACTN|nr:VOC family protein [Actinomadura rubrisoli]TDD95355.1 4-hydroxyphenylpyruvate dioxygenase [Actinomadura rubrisoli]
MHIDAIDHVEFYVGDARQAAYYLCTAFGFRIRGQAGPETGLADQRSLQLRHGGVDLLLTSGLGPDHPATEYVARHGDGIAKIAFRVADAARTLTEATRRGGTVVSEPSRFEAGDAAVTIAEVAGVGDLAHPLIEREGPGTGFLPGVMEMLPADGDPHGDTGGEPHGGTDGDPDGETGGEPDGGLFRELDHVAVCLPAGTLHEAVHFYGQVFDFPEIFSEYVEVGRQAMASKVVQSRSANATFTLIEPDTNREPGQIDAFLRAHRGAGVQHLAFRTDDIAAAVRTLTDRGVRFLETPPAYYDRLDARLGTTDLDSELLRRHNILADRDHSGELFQIFSKSMHVRGTFFTEVIERRGARTFGSSNIKALYEAVERAASDSPRPGEDDEPDQPGQGPEAAEVVARA